MVPNNAQYVVTIIVTIIKPTFLRMQMSFFLCLNFKSIWEITGPAMILTLYKEGAFIHT